MTTTTMQLLQESTFLTLYIPATVFDPVKAIEEPRLVPFTVPTVPPQSPKEDGVKVLSEIKFNALWQEIEQNHKKEASSSGKTTKQWFKVYYYNQPSLSDALGETYHLPVPAITFNNDLLYSLASPNVIFKGQLAVGFPIPPSNLFYKFSDNTHIKLFVKHYMNIDTCAYELYHEKKDRTDAMDVIVGTVVGPHGNLFDLVVPLRESFDYHGGQESSSSTAVLSIPTPKGRYERKYRAAVNEMKFKTGRSQRFTTASYEYMTEDAARIVYKAVVAYLLDNMMSH